MHKKYLVTNLLIILIIIMQSCSNTIIKGDWELIGSGFKFPEGPVWTTDNKLYFSNCKGDFIGIYYNNKIDTLVMASDSTFIQTNGLFPADNGSFYACEYGKGQILKISNKGKCDVLISGFNNNYFNRPNDITTDHKGNLYFTDPKSWGPDKPDGRVFFYNFNTSELKMVGEGLCFPNGIKQSPKNKKLYICESAQSRILEYNINENGSITDQKVFIQLPGGDPDGIEFDVRGNMYVAHFGTGHVYVISPDGNILQKIKTPGKKPSNLEFGESDNKTLFLTEDETNSLYKIRTKYKGYRK